jgi:hypothetical protein
LFGPHNLEFPIGGIALKCLISEVKEKMPQILLNRANLNPIIWALRQPQITLYLVELPPLWCHLAESALATIPTLIVGGSQTVSLAAEKAQSADILGAGLRKPEGIHQERDDYISTLDLNSGIRRIGSVFHPSLRLRNVVIKF